MPPTETVGLVGLIAMDASGGGTVRVVFAVVLPYVAVMVVAPVAIPVAMPVVELMLAMFEELEDHVTNAVKSCNPPSLNVAVASRGTDIPAAKTGFAGVMVSSVSCADGTVIAAEPQIEPAQALIVAVPADRAKTAPALVESLVTVATFVAEELQLTESKDCVVLSLNVPTALNRCAVATGTEALLGLSATETRVAGAVVAGWYNSALPRVLELMSSPPAIKTFPLFKSVAVSNFRAVVRLPMVVKAAATGS